MKKHFSIILLGAIVIAAAVFIISSRPANGPKTSEQVTSKVPGSQNVDTSAGQMVLVGGSAIYVADQKPGNSVVVSTVVFGEPGFIMIHKSVDGAPGEIIGTGDYVESGGDMLIVEVDSPMVDGEKYFAMLHKDDGDKVYKSPAIDPPITDSLGNIVMMEFSVDTNAEEPPVVAF